ncbi:MAG: DUF4843 domain-containing protein [Odoribacter sp.]
MRNLIKYILGVSALCSLGGCNTDLMNYEGNAGVYFAVQYPWISGAGDSTVWQMVPITDVSFFLLDVKDSTINIRVQLLGDPVAHDRYFSIAVVDTATTAVVGYDYDPLESNYKLAANTHYTDIKVTVHKQDDLSGKQRKFMLELKETPDFKLPVNMWYPWPGQYKWEPSIGAGSQDISAIRHTVYISDVVKTPAGWLLGIFGSFSKTKFDKMCEVLNLTINDFSKEAMNSVRAKALAQRMDAYLKDHPILDEDGKPMGMGTMI